MLDLSNLEIDESFLLQNDLYFVYILKCFYSNQKSCFYTGYSGDLKRRISEHMKYPSGYVKRFKSKKLVYLEIYFDLKEAKKRELYIKSLSSSEKKALISKKILLKCKKCYDFMELHSIIMNNKKIKIFRCKCCRNWFYSPITNI